MEYHLLIIHSDIPINANLSKGSSCQTLSTVCVFVHTVVQVFKTSHWKEWTMHHSISRFLEFSCLEENMDWLQSLVQFFINASYNKPVASLT